MQESKLFAHSPVSQDGDTPLHWAALNGHNEVCRVLITEGKADVNIKDNVSELVLLCGLSILASKMLYYVKISAQVLALSFLVILNLFLDLSTQSCDFVWSRVVRLQGIIWRYLLI